MNSGSPASQRDLYLQAELASGHHCIMFLKPALDICTFHHYALLKSQSKYVRNLQHFNSLKKHLS